MRILLVFMKIKRFLVFLIVIIFLVDLAYFYPRLTGKGFYEWESVNVTRVLDGDTLEIGGEGERRVRLLCINAPEKNKAFYDEARSKLAELEDKEIGVLRDKTDEDKYNRKLRYVFYNGRFITKEILEEGLANLYMCENLRYEKELRKAEKKARKQEKGIWKKSTSKCRDCIVLKELDPEEEYFILENTCNFDCENLEVKDEANHFFDISLKRFEEKKIKSKGRIWNDDGDSLFLRDSGGLLLYYCY